MVTRRQLIASGAGLFAAAVSPSRAQEAAELGINSSLYISTNADTGAIFAQRGADDQVAIASLTKVFTAIEALSIAPLDTLITTSDDDMQSSDATVMGFGPNETFTLAELMYGMMLPSGNDAAAAIARSLGFQDGDDAQEATDRFMALVNQRVQAMGLKNTQLVNPDGWGVDGHYSSAADVAAFMAYASRNDFLMEVMGTSRYTTSGGYTLVNSNKVLNSSPSVIAGKTGYDWDSGWCLVQMAERKNTRIVAVTLDGIAPDDWYNDNLTLLDYGFDQQAALGSNPFDGKFVSWSDPAPALFAEASVGSAIISGKTADKQIVAEREIPLPIRERVDPTPDPMEDTGNRGGPVLAGIGATLLAGTMGAIRWADLGGTRTPETISPSLKAATASLKRLSPISLSLPRRQPGPGTAAIEATDDSSEGPNTHDEQV